MKVQVRDEEGNPGTVDLTVIDWDNPANNDFLNCSEFSGGYFCWVLRGHPGLLKGRVVVRFRLGWRNVADWLQ